MDRALWFLLWLRFHGWYRRLGRAMRTPKGIALALLGLLIFVPMLLAVIVTSAIPEVRLGDPHMARHYGPLLLLGYCLSIVLFSSADRGLTFTPAEVDFLFPGPFSRRQLLAYKIAGTLLGSLLTTLLLTLWFQMYAVRLAAAFVGLFLIITFLQLFNIATALVIGTLGELAYNRARKVLLVGGGIAVLGILLPWGRQVAVTGGSDFLERLNDSPLGATLLFPFRCFVEAFTAERLWPDLTRWALPALAIDGVLLGVVFALDTHYLETAASASKRHYARLQRLRQGGSALAASAKVGHAVRWSLPGLPWWGGAGPLIWRQTLTALRGIQGFAFTLAVLALTILTPLLFQLPSTQREAIAGLLGGGMLPLLLLFLPMMLTFDFRGDLDRMDYLKALPLPATGLVLGQLAVPVAIGSASQLLLLAVLAVLDSEGRAVAQATAAFVVPFNFFFYAVENLVFLAYPTRMVPAGPGDFQHLGRHVLVLAAKGILLMTGALVLSVSGTLAYFLSGGNWLATGAVVWLLLVGAGAALVPLILFFFHRFDVSRDTPP